MPGGGKELGYPISSTEMQVKRTCCQGTCYMASKNPSKMSKTNLDHCSLTLVALQKGEDEWMNSTLVRSGRESDGCEGDRKGVSVCSGSCMCCVKE